MKYFIPGLGQPDAKEDKIIKTALNARTIHINWSKPLVPQAFNLKFKKGDIVVGFSFGALIAAIAADHNDTKAILCSMTPVWKYSLSQIEKDAKTYMNKTNAKKQALTLKMVDFKYLLKRHLSFAGSIEKKKYGVSAKIYIKNTNHELTDKYLQEINKHLKQV